MIAIKDTALACCKHRIRQVDIYVRICFSNWNVDSASSLLGSKSYKVTVWRGSCIAFYDPIMGESVFSLYLTVIISPRLSFSAV
jgi:hypothetical protein